MPLLPLELPPGMYKNGTPYTRRARWTDGNLVRWHDGSIRPLGGWTQRADVSGVAIPALIADATLEAVRDVFAWRDNDQDRNVVFGSNLAAYHMNTAGTVTNITYAGYTATNVTKDADITVGYGENPYGSGQYGTENNLSGADPTPPNRWYFSNFGEILLFGSRNNAGLYEYDQNTGVTSAVSGAPDQAQDVCVTEQRQVMLIGGGGQPRRLQASEIEDRTSWTAATSNQVVDRVIPGSGRLLRCLPVLRQTLLLGESDAHVVRYIGPPYVYSVDLEGTNCGPLAAEAVVSTDRFAAWWGERTFWIYDGAIQPLSCDVIDFLYTDLDLDQVSKISATSNTNFNEVTWLYQSTSTTTTELDSYVTWNYVSNHWTVGRIDRTAALDSGVLNGMIMISSGGVIYNHELDGVIPDGTTFVESGAIDLAGGEKNMAVRYIYPDTEATAGTAFTLIARQLPNDTEYSYGPYAFQSNNPIPTRALGRSIKLRVDFTTAEAELGTVRFDIAPIGTGKR